MNGNYINFDFRNLYLIKKLFKILTIIENLTYNDLINTDLIK
jgi:hypothetical protein